jgi:cytochrome c oxidase subunit 2
VRGAEAEIGGETVVANGITGPDLTHFASRDWFAGAIFERNEETLTAWVSNAPEEKPGSLMPAGIGEMGLSAEDVEAIVAYLQSLE